MKYADQIRKMILWMLTLVLVTGLFSGSAVGVRAEDTGVQTLQYLPQETVAELEQRMLAAWDSYAASCDVSDLEIDFLDKDSVLEVYFGLLYRNPMYFYVDLTLGYTFTYETDNVTGIQSGKIIRSLTISYNLSQAQAQEKRIELERARDKALKGLKIGWSDLEKALYLHDYLCLNCTYDTSLKDYTAYDALVSGKAMCQGYSQAYILLLRAAGVESLMVYSRELVHAWNLVKLGGLWYHVDVTWDDPTPDRPGRAKHDYFLRSATWFGTDDMHSGVSDWKIFNGFDPHAANARTYDSAVWAASDTAFYYVKGKWYGYDKAKKAVYRYSCNGRTLKRAAKMKSLKGVKWRVFNSTNRYYKDQFVGICAKGSFVYYTISDKVYRLKVTNKKVKKLYTLSKARKKKGYIYGLYLTSGNKLKIYVAKASEKKGKTYTVKSL